MKPGFAARRPRAGLCAVAFALGLPMSVAAEPASSFEGALVLAVPRAAAEEGPQEGDVLMAVDGAPAPSLAAMRRRIADAIGRPLKVSVRRGGAEIMLEWTPGPGVYRLAAWPTAGEQFRRRHADRAGDPAVEAAARGIDAAQQGRARTALRLLEEAAGAGLQDPLLDWARGWILLRHQNATDPAADALWTARRGADALEGPGAAAARALCRLAEGHLHTAAGRLDDGMRLCRAAREEGADAADLERELGAALLGAGRAREGRDLLEAAFEDDPLDAALAEHLARLASTEAQRTAYVGRALRLSGRPLDPRIELKRLTDRLAEDASVADALTAFLDAHPEMTAADQAAALEATAASLDERERAADALALRARAFRAAPTRPRAEALARDARRLGRYSPVLAALRSLYAAKTLRRDVLVGYMNLYTPLYLESFERDGLPVVEEAIRRRRAGRQAEAVEFLHERSHALALPELNVISGLFLKESGSLAEEKDGPYFHNELMFWYDGSHDPWWAHYYMHCVFAARTGHPEHYAARHADLALKYVGPPEYATVRTARAGLLWNAGEADAARKALQKAADALSHPESGRYWQTLYTQGRLCRSPREWIEALDEAWGAEVRFPPPAEKK
jgi:hypothetical protein